MLAVVMATLALSSPLYLAVFNTFAKKPHTTAKNLTKGCVMTSGPSDGDKSALTGALAVPLPVTLRGILKVL